MVSRVTYFLIGLLSCLITMGPYYCYDLPSAINSQLKTSVYVDGIPMTATEFSLLFSVVLFPSIFVSLLGGYLLDRVLGLYKGLIFCIVTVLGGQVLFSIGVQNQSYVLLLIGRVVFALGKNPMQIAQNIFLTKWFKDGHLSLAMGLGLASSRIGAGLNFLFSGVLAEQAGVSASAWLGTAVTGVSALSGLLLIVLDRRHSPALVRGEVNLPPSKATPISLATIRAFPVLFWLICGIVTAMYCGIYPFNATCTEFIANDGRQGTAKTHYLDPETMAPYWSLSEAGYISSIPSFMSVLSCPLFGLIADKCGRRLQVLIFSAGGLAVVHVVFALSSEYWLQLSEVGRAALHPITTMVVYGLLYSLVVANLFPCVSLVVTEVEHIGTAYGIVFCVQSGGIALVAYLMGLVIDADGYIPVEYAYVGVEMLSLLLLLVAYRIDTQRGAVLSCGTEPKIEYAALSLVDDNEPS